MKNPGEFHEVISKLLMSKLAPVITEGMTLNLVTCVEIYQTIFDTLVETLTGAEVAITNEAMNYLAQQYYLGVQVNGGQELDPEIFTQLAKLENITTKELALLATMLAGTDFGAEIILEIKKRQ